MVIISLETGGDVLEWHAIGKDVMGRLQIKGFFHLCVRGHIDMEKNQERNRQRDQGICLHSIRVQIQLNNKHLPIECLMLRGSKATVLQAASFVISHLNTKRPQDRAERH